MRFLLILFLASTCDACAPATRALGRCPGFAPLLTDFAIGGVALGAAVDNHSELDHDTRVTVGLVAVAAVVGLAANMSECR